MTRPFVASSRHSSQADLKDRGWCLVVVGDKKGPKAYDIKGMDGSAIVFLDHNAQEALAQASPFVHNLPWNHFGRKNVGYLYAILRGARTIWDFDDDNVLLPGRSIPDLLDPDRGLDILNPANHNHAVFNPYPKMGAPSLPSYVTCLGIGEAHGALNTSLGMGSAS